MDEAKRLIRYLYPGLVFIVEILLFLFISAPERLITFPSSNYFISIKDNIGVLGGATLLVLTGLGYFFGILYHAMFKLFRPSNSLPFLIDAVKNKWIVLYHRDSKEKFTDNCMNKLKAKDAWCILGAYYHARIYSDKFKKAHERIGSLNDTMHSLGTTFVGSFFSIGVWIQLHRLIGEPLKWYDFIVPIIVLMVMVCNYRSTAKEANHFADNITSEFMEFESRYTTINLYV